MKAQLLTITLIYDTYSFEQLNIKNISPIKYKVWNAYFTILLKIIGKEDS